VVVDETVNAYWQVSGLRRRRVLGLGVPLLAILEPQERVALVAHELAHARNGDVGRTLVVSSALRTLEEIYLTLTPGESMLTYSDVGVFEVVARGMMWLLAQPVKWLYVFELHLLLSDMQ